MTDKQALRRIAKNVRELRLAAALSYSELARRIDDYARTIQRLEQEDHMPGIGLVTRIAEALDVTVNDLLSETTPVLQKAS